MSYDHNPYYNPERHGLEIVFDDNRGGSYEFDMFIVWRSRNGTLFYGADAGCSCPSPFEDVASVEELTEATIDETIAAYRSWLDSSHSSDVPKDTQPLRAALTKETR